jgi:acid phosphatase
MNTNVLLNKRYKPSQVIIRASSYNRTIESAQSFLSGLYPPGLGPSLTTDQFENALPGISIKGIEDIKQELRDASMPQYQRLIPIHTSTVKNDYIFSPNTVCKSAIEDDKLYEKARNKLKQKYSDLSNDLNKEFEGIFPEQQWSAEDCYKLYDNILALKQNCIPLKKEVNVTLLKELKEAAVDENMNDFLASPVKVKLFNYVILSSMRKHFANAVADIESGASYDDMLRLALFHLSDSHILSLHKLFGWTLTDPVAFSSSLIFELHMIEDVYGNELYTVKALYNGKEMNLAVDGNGKERFLNKYDNFDKFLAANAYPSDDDYKYNCFNYIQTYIKETFFALAIVIYISLVAIWAINWFVILQKSPEDVKSSKESSLSELNINEGSNPDKSLLDEKKIN